MHCPPEHLQRSCVKQQIFLDINLQKPAHFLDLHDKALLIKTI